MTTGTNDVVDLPRLLESMVALEVADRSQRKIVERIVRIPPIVTEVLEPRLHARYGFGRRHLCDADAVAQLPSFRPLLHEQCQSQRRRVLGDVERNPPIGVGGSLVASSPGDRDEVLPTESIEMRVGEPELDGLCLDGDALSRGAALSAATVELDLRPVEVRVIVELEAGLRGHHSNAVTGELRARVQAQERPVTADEHVGPALQADVLARDEDLVGADVDTRISALDPNSTLGRELDPLRGADDVRAMSVVLGRARPVGDSHLDAQVSLNLRRHVALDRLHPPSFHEVVAGALGELVPIAVDVLRERGADTNRPIVSDAFGGVGANPRRAIGADLLSQISLCVQVDLLTAASILEREFVEAVSSRRRLRSDTAARLV